MGYLAGLRAAGRVRTEIVQATLCWQAV
jgi:hypothetical protein